MPDEPLSFGADAPLTEIMRTMRAMRRLKPDPVPRELLERLVEAATWAPNGGNSQTYQFVVVDDRDQMEKLAEIWRRCHDVYVRGQSPPPHMSQKAFDRLLAALKHQRDHFHETPAVIVAGYSFKETIDRMKSNWTEFIGGMRELSPKQAALAVANLSSLGSRSEAASVLPGVQNLLLLARAEGLGATLTTWHVMFEQEVKSVLGIPRHVHTYALIPVGYPLGNFGPVKRRPLAESLHWNKWSDG